ncbi:MAG: DegT/DnrJ/EryC1/StrS family aminotransferase [Leptonema sp. (in: bacteria)]
MQVPFIDLKRFENNFIDEFTKKIKIMIENTQFIGGKEVDILENNLKEDNQTQYSITCANGTDALQLALRAVGVGSQDKVILPDLTFWATFEAVVNVGAEPITIDISLDDLQMDFELFQEAIEKFKPKAAILVHLYGWASHNIQKFRDYAKEKNLILIEDGAQSYGVKVNGESVYKNAQISTISFYPAKVFGAAGDGGAVLTNIQEIAEIVRSLSNHGRRSHYSYDYVGWNSRLDALQAAFLNLSFPYLKKRIESRKRIQQQYKKDLQQLGIHVFIPKGLVSEYNPKEQFVQIEENGYLNVIFIEKHKREKFIEHLKKNQIGFGIVYPETISEQKGSIPYLKSKLTKNHAKQVTETIVNLPLFPYMTEQEYETIIKVIKNF